MKRLFNALEAFLKPPAFEGDEEKTHAAELVNTLLLSQIGLFAIAFVTYIFSGGHAPFGQVIGGFVFLAFLFGLLWSLRRGYVRGTGITLLVLLTLFTGFALASSGTIREPIISIFLLASIFAGLAMGRRAAVVSVIVDILIVAGVAYGEWNHLLPSPETSTTPQLVVIFGIAGALTIVLLNQALRRNETFRALANAKQRELTALNVGLEQRVAERTQALANVAEISTAASQIRDVQEMLAKVVQLTQRRFGLYHAHVFTYQEEADELKIMACGWKEGDEHEGTHGLTTIPLAREQSLVARAARTKQAVIVNDVRRDPSWLPNPLLPDTASELAVPLLVGEQVLGVLDVQSDRLNAFSESDASIQTTLAAQVGVAIQNARLYTQTELTRQEAQSLVDYAPEAIVVVDLETGLFIDPNENAARLYGLSREELLKVGPAQMSPPKQPDGRDSTEKAMERINEAMQGKAPIFEWIHRNARGQDIPCEVRLVRLPGEHPRVRASVTDITERKRFEELMTQRAQHQETLNLIIQKIQSTTDIETAMKVAARELGRALGMKPTRIMLDPAALSGDGREKKENA